MLAATDNRRCVIRGSVPVVSCILPLIWNWIQFPRTEYLPKRVAHLFHSWPKMDPGEQRNRCHLSEEPCPLNAVTAAPFTASDSISQPEGYYMRKLSPVWSMRC